MSGIITSRQNPLCAHLRKLCAQRRYRREAGEYLLDGEKLWEEAVLWRAPIRRVVTTPQHELRVPAGVEQTLVTPELMAYLSPMESPQGVLFTVALPKIEAPEQVEAGRYLALDSLQDPGNVGTIWRTADALGADGLFLIGGCADPYGPKTVRATMGACFRLPVWEVTAGQLQRLMRKAGLPIYGATLRGDSLELGRTRLGHGVVVIGNEGRGISPETLEICDRAVRIPMRERCESLNAAAAATVILWEMGKG